jgi:hypothetical protein
MLHTPANEGKVTAGRRRSEPVALTECQSTFPDAVQGRHSIDRPSNLYGNQAMLRMGTRRTPLTALRPSGLSAVQRKCACGGACPRCRGDPGTQATLAIGEAGDQFEQEADRIADTVMHMPDAPSKAPQTVSALQRKCAACESEEPKKLQGKYEQSAASGRGPVGINATATAPPIVHEVLRTPGQPLDSATLAFMEPRFGSDFSGVRVHSDASAAESARAVDALAYTVGHDVVFAEGRYAPGTGRGQQLLAHELTHVLQQSSGNASGGIDDRSRAADHSAQRASPRVLQRDDVPTVEIPPDWPPPPTPFDEVFPNSCNLRLVAKTCDDLSKRFADEIADYPPDSLSPGIKNEYRFECPFGQQPDSSPAYCFLFDYPWIMISKQFPSRGWNDSNFNCGDHVTICSDGQWTEATVVERRYLNMRDDAWVSPAVAKALNQPTYKGFQGAVVYPNEYPSSYPCCPSTKPVGPGDYEPPKDDQAIV